MTNHPNRSPYAARYVAIGEACHYYRALLIDPGKNAIQREQARETAWAKLIVVGDDQQGRSLYALPDHSPSNQSVTADVDRAIIAWAAWHDRRRRAADEKNARVLPEQLDAMRRHGVTVVEYALDAAYVRTGSGEPRWLTLADANSAAIHGASEDERLVNGGIARLIRANADRAARRAV